jgi:hypothetical protein
MNKKNICFYRKQGFDSFFIVIILLYVMLSGCDKDTNRTTGINVVNMSGSWRINETINGNCLGEVYPFDKMDVAAVKQINNSIAIVYSSLGTDFTGSVIGNTISFSGEYENEGGTNTIDFTGTLSADGNSFTGDATWIWSDGGYTCSGTAQVNGNKIAQVINDVEGDWAGEWETDDGNSNGTFSLSIIQSDENLSGLISCPELGLVDAELSGTFTGNSILFGDIENEILFYGVAESETSLIGCFTLSYFDEEGTWNATKVASD